jgi:hypothetical protein
MGVAQGVISEAKRHVQAKERYQELAGVSRRQALRLMAEWDAMTPQQRYRRYGNDSPENGPLWCNSGFSCGV